MKGRAEDSNRMQVSYVHSSGCAPCPAVKLLYISFRTTKLHLGVAEANQLHHV